jgi:hypothetical protein
MFSNDERLDDLIGWEPPPPPEQPAVKRRPAAATSPPLEARTRRLQLSLRPERFRRQM